MRHTGLFAALCYKIELEWPTGGIEPYPHRQDVRLPLDQILYRPGHRQIERNERSNGTGDILFARNLTTTYNDNTGRSTNTNSVGFYGIPDARSVEKLIVDTFKTPHE
jgi:hypothetical protein